MIIRIMGSGQYEIDSCMLDRVNDIDNRIVSHIEKGDLSSYKKDLSLLISTIKENGKPLDPASITKSDVIVPPEDLTIDEARKLFKGEGLIPG